MPAVRADAVKVFRVERADWKPISATQVTISSQLILNISYLPQTKPARKHSTKVARKGL
jgi:hypothetical protein